MRLFSHAFDQTYCLAFAIRMAVIAFTTALDGGGLV